MTPKDHIVGCRLAVVLSMLPFLAACGEDANHVPQLVGRPFAYTIAPGQKYRIAMPGPVDDFEIGKHWTGIDLSTSPLGFMTRIPIIIKADDYGQPLNQAACDFIEMVDQQGGVVSLGIITSRLDDRLDVAETYRTLHRAGFENWFHGHTHDYKLPSEFSGPTVGSQAKEFEIGIERGRELLGLEFHSFGAPGNSYDGSTAVALMQFPQIVVWLFGYPAADSQSVAGLRVLPRLIEFESGVGNVAEPSSLLASLDTAKQADIGDLVVTLQAHPNRFNENDLERARQIFSALKDKRATRITSPYAWWKWQRDRSEMTLTKTEASAYILDASAMSFAHVLEFPADGVVPFAFQEF